MHLVGFTIEKYYDARPYGRHICASIRKMHFVSATVHLL